MYQIFKVARCLNQDVPTARLRRTTGCERREEYMYIQRTILIYPFKKRLMRAMNGVAPLMLVAVWAIDCIEILLPRISLIVFL